MIPKTRIANTGCLVSIQSSSHEKQEEPKHQLLKNDRVVLEFIRDGDGDLDDFTNREKLALNKNLDFPNKALVYKLVEVEDQKYLENTFSRPAELGAYSIYLKASNDVTTWEKIQFVISETFTPSNNTYTVTIRDIQALSAGGRFIRLRVTDEE